MSLFSFLRTNKQESISADHASYSHAPSEKDVLRSRRGKRKLDKQNEALPDPVLPEKKRARRRLMGAIALVLAAIIGLPMILDSEPKSLTDDIVIQIPSKDKIPHSSDSRQSVLAASRISAAASLDVTEEMIEPFAVPATNSKLPTQAAPSGTVEQRRGIANDKSHDGTSQPEASRIVAGNKSSTPEFAAKLENKNMPKLVEKTDDSIRTKTYQEISSESKAAIEKKSGKFIIQVAALASKEKVNELQVKLKEAGIKSYTQKVTTETGERIRIRIGPFMSKDEADKMRAKIGKLGLNSTVVPA